MKKKQELEKLIDDTQRRYKDIIFGKNSRICEGCLNELREQGTIHELGKVKGVTGVRYMSHPGQYSWGRQGTYWWKDCRDYSSVVDNKCCRKTFWKILWPLI